MADSVESGSTIVAASAAAAARAANRFGMGLFAFLAAAAAAAAAAKKVNREAPRAANVFFSPPSLLSTLGLLASAATEGSAAAVELDAVAGLRLTDDETAAAVFGEGGRSARPGSLHAVMSPDNDAGVALHYTSGVWLRGGIDATYSQRVAALYGATAAALTTAAPINGNSTKRPVRTVITRIWPVPARASDRRWGRNDGRGARRERLRHLGGGQVAPGEHGTRVLGRTVRPLTDPAWLRPLLRLPPR